MGPERREGHAEVGAGGEVDGGGEGERVEPAPISTRAVGAKREAPVGQATEG